MLSIKGRLINSLKGIFRREKTEKFRTELFQGEKFFVNFEKTKVNPFLIDEDSEVYDSFLSEKSLSLGLKKSNCIAWIEIPEHEYTDHIIEAKFKLESFYGYGASGLMFHIMDGESYYMALVSSKGFFRVDLVKENNVRHLIAWTEVPDFDSKNIKLKIITFGTYLIFIINDKWIAETNDDSNSAGRAGFVAASYEEAPYKEGENSGEYKCLSELSNFSIETNPEMLEKDFDKWSDDSNIDADRRLLLAETFAVMGEAEKALKQINKAWQRRDEVISSASVSYTEVRTKRELLLAARMSFKLGLYKEAEEYVDKILDQWKDSAEWKEALTEKVKILNELEKYGELKDFVLQYNDSIRKDIDFYVIYAKCLHELNEHKESAVYWDKAFKIESENGVYAVNAAASLEQAGKIKEALERYLKAGNIFLRDDNKSELSSLIPKLLTLGEDNYEARSLAGKWFFSIEDYDRSEKEFAKAEKIILATEPKMKGDPAVYYLWGLVLNIKGKQKKAITMLRKAVKNAPDYGLFRFKLAEFRLTAGEDTEKIAKEFKLALVDMDEESREEMGSYAENLLKQYGYENN